MEVILNKRNFSLEIPQKVSYLKELLLPWTLKWVLKIACSAWYASFPNENWSYLPHTSVEKIEIIKFRFCIRSVKNFSRKRIRKTFWSTHWHKFSWSMTLCKLFFLSSDEKILIMLSTTASSQFTPSNLRFYAPYEMTLTKAKDKHNHADFVWRVSNFSKILNLQKNQELDAFYNAIFPTEFTLLWNHKIRLLIDRRIAKLVLDLRLWKKKKKTFFKRCVSY